MQRYFLQQPFDGNRAVITGDDSKHIAKVMRMNAGDKIIAVDNGKAFIAVIDELTSDSAVIQKQEELQKETEQPVSVTIACGLPKGDKLDLITQKATELGMKQLIPFAAARSVVKWDAKKSGKKIERLEKIAKEAAEQCHRTEIPEIAEVQSLKQLIETADAFDVKLFADEEDAKSDEPHKLRDRLKNTAPGESLLIVFGPEGGLAREETAALMEAGFLPAALGPRILRTETAPLYVLAAVSYEFE